MHLCLVADMEVYAKVHDSLGRLQQVRGCEGVVYTKTVWHERMWVLHHIMQACHLGHGLLLLHVHLELLPL